MGRPFSMVTSELTAESSSAYVPGRDPVFFPRDFLVLAAGVVDARAELVDAALVKRLNLSTASEFFGGDSDEGADCFLNFLMMEAPELVLELSDDESEEEESLEKGGEGEAAAGDGPKRSASLSSRYACMFW